MQCSIDRSSNACEPTLIQAVDTKARASLSNPHHRRSFTVDKADAGTLAADSSPHYSLIAFEDGESEREVGVAVSRATSIIRVDEWLSKVPERVVDGDLRKISDIPIVRKPVGKAGTEGRDTAVIEENRGGGGSVPDDLIREKVTDRVPDLLAHLTISQDQTSGSKFSQENLAALSKPLKETNIALVCPTSRQSRHALRTFRAIANLLNQTT